MKNLVSEASPRKQEPPHTPLSRSPFPSVGEGFYLSKSVFLCLMTSLPRSRRLSGMRG